MKLHSIKVELYTEQYEAQEQGRRHIFSNIY